MSQALKNLGECAAGVIAESCRKPQRNFAVLVTWCSLSSSRSTRCEITSPRSEITLKARLAACKSHLLLLCVCVGDCCMFGYLCVRGCVHPRVCDRVQNS